MKKILICTFLILLPSLIFSQNFTRQDTLRGSITPERAWWDLTYYHLDISVDPDNRFIKGSNTVQYKVLETNDEMQIDLQEPLKITKIIQDGNELYYRSDGYSHFIKLKKKQIKGKIKSLKIYYEGNPKIAVNPPWDGGGYFIFPKMAPDPGTCPSWSRDGVHPGAGMGLILDQGQGPS